MIRQYAMVRSAGGDAFRQAQHGTAAEVCESVVNAAGGWPDAHRGAGHFRSSCAEFEHRL